MHIYLKTSSRYFFIPLLSVCLSFFIFCCWWCCFLHTIWCCVFKNLSLPFSLMYIFSFYRVSVWLLRLCCTFKAAERRKKWCAGCMYIVRWALFWHQPMYKALHCFGCSLCLRNAYLFFLPVFISLSLALSFYYSLADKRVSDWTRKCEYDALIYAMDVFQKICFVHNINDTRTHKHTNSNDVQRRHRPPLQKRFVVGGGGVSCFESGGRYYKKKSSHILHHASTNSRFVIKKRISKQ